MSRSSVRLWALCVASLLLSGVAAAAATASARLDSGQVEGEVLDGPKQETIQDGRLRGDQISFKFGSPGALTSVNGKIKNDELAVTFSGSGTKYKESATYFGTRR